MARKEDKTCVPQTPTYPEGELVEYRRGETAIHDSDNYIRIVQGTDYINLSKSGMIFTTDNMLHGYKNDAMAKAIMDARDAAVKCGNFDPAAKLINDMQQQKVMERPTRGGR